MRFAYFIRGLAGRPASVRISDARGMVVHERALSPVETADTLHDAQWDGLVSVGAGAGERIADDRGPCRLEVIHDEQFCDAASFRIAGEIGFEVRVVDDIGAPVEGVELELLLDGEATSITSDADGLASHAGREVPSLASAGLRIVDIAATRELLQPRWAQNREGDAPKPSAEVLHVPVRASWPGASLARGRARTIVLQPSLVCVRLLGMHFDTSKSFLLPGAMRGIARLRELYEDHQDARVVVCGHTDTAGKQAYNLDLSLERAEAIVAYLTDDVDAWDAWFSPDHPAAKRWGTAEIQHMLAALPSADAPYYAKAVDGVFGGGTRSAVEGFQTDHGLGPTGEVDEDTRMAIITDYMGIDGTTLPDGVEIEAHGCGELFPATATANAVAQADNRRVDVFLFDGPVHPPLPGPLAEPGSSAYPTWQERALQTHVLDADGEIARTAQIRVHLRSNSGCVVLEDRPYEIDVDGTVHEGVTDADGLARADAIASGDYSISVEGHRSRVASRPHGSAPVIHTLAGYYLRGPNDG